MKHCIRLSALVMTALMLLSVCSCQLLPELTPDNSMQSSPTPAYQPAVSPSDGTLTLDALQDRLNADRWAATRDDYGVSGYLPDYTSPDFAADEFSPEELSLLTSPPGDQPAQISYEQAAEDVEYLFRILRTSYGAYTFFGGDEAFGAAKDSILETLLLYYPGGITPSDFRSLILGRLRFVEDTHFDIGGKGVDFAERYYYRTNEELLFRRDSLGYYFTDAHTGSRWYLSSDDEQWMHLTIAESGELMYGLFALCSLEESLLLPDSISIGSTDSRYDTVALSWAKMDCPFIDDDDPYTYQEIDGIPVISLDTYYLEENVFDEINCYLNDSLALRGEDVVVIDLRYNTGGYDLISEMWLYEFTGGSFVDWGIGYSAYISRMNEYVLNSNAAEVSALFEQLDFFDRHPDYWGDSSDTELYETGDLYEIPLSGDMQQNDTTFFVLFNKHTYSAGELSLFQMENMENVIFAGMNSNGCLLTGGTNMDAPVWLPNSGLSVYYSTILVTSEIMHGFDANGFLPDIILADENAVQYVINCWNYYNHQD